MRYVITTPEPRWTGEVAGVAFAHGEGITGDTPPARVLNYFRRRGYGVTPVEQVDARDDGDAADSAESAAETEGTQKPGKTANKDELVAYAVTELGLDEDDAKAKTRVELLDLIDKHKENEQ
jgi:hypothetical protein